VKRHPRPHPRSDHRRARPAHRRDRDERAKTIRFSTFPGRRLRQTAGLALGKRRQGPLKRKLLSRRCMTPLAASSRKRKPARREKIPKNIRGGRHFFSSQCRPSQHARLQPMTNASLHALVANPPTRKKLRAKRSPPQARARSPAFPPRVERRALASASRTVPRSRKNFSVTSTSGRGRLDGHRVSRRPRPTSASATSLKLCATRFPKLTLMGQRHQRRRVDFSPAAAATRSRSPGVGLGQAPGSICIYADRRGRGHPPTHCAPRPLCSAAKKEKREAIADGGHQRKSATS